MPRRSLLSLLALAAWPLLSFFPASGASEAESVAWSDTSRDVVLGGGPEPVGTVTR